MSFSCLGLLVGLALGLALTLGGLSAFFGTLLVGAVGYAAGRVMDGSIDIRDLGDRFNGRKRP